MDNPVYGIVRVHISPDLLFSAFNFAKMCHELELKGESDDDLKTEKHTSYVMASILSAVAFLESTINEFYYVATDKVLEIGRMPEEYRDKLSALWIVKSFRRGARILEKYQSALLLLNKEAFDEGNEPFQSVKILIDLRNALVHYVPQTAVIRPDPLSDQIGDLEKKLKGRFEANPFIPKFPVISSSQPERRADYPFFPERCLGYGCSKWAANCCLSFVNDFFDRVKVNWHYKHILSKLPVLE